MQQKEEVEQSSLKEYQLFENYFSTYGVNSDNLSPVSLVEKYLNSVLSDADEDQSRSLDKYLASLNEESAFSSPTTLSSCSEISSISDTSHSQSTEQAAELYDNPKPSTSVGSFNIPDISIPLVDEGISPMHAPVNLAKVSTHSLFDWPAPDRTVKTVLIAEKKKLMITGPQLAAVGDDINSKSINLLLKQNMTKEVNISLAVLFGIGYETTHLVEKKEIKIRPL